MKSPARAGLDNYGGEMINWKHRLGIAISVIWLLFVLMVASSSEDAIGFIILAGAMPLSVAWLVWWVVSGYMSRKTE
jgi:hypothetical protein